MICSITGIIFIYGYPAIGQCQDISNFIKKNPLKLSKDRNFRSKKGYDVISNDEDFFLTNTVELFRQSDINASGKARNSWSDNVIDVNYKAGFLKEVEENYNTTSIYQNVRLIKQFSDVFRLSLNFGVDYATRNEEGLPEVNKWYDNTALRADIDFNPYNTLSLFGSGSISDSTWTAYGTSLRSTIEFEEVQIKNVFVASYEYFYYWTQVGQNFVSDNVNVQYENFTLNTGYFYGVVDYNYIEGYTALARNPNSLFNIELLYTIFQDPIIKTGAQFYTRNFKYHSPLYYSPQDRMIGGLSASYFDTFGKYYLYLGGGANADNNDVFFWSGDFEAGYDNDDFSVSVGVSRYNDPYYANYNTFLNLFKRF